MNDKTDLTVIEGGADETPRTEIVQQRSAFDISPQVFKAGLERRKKNRDALMAWIRESLVEDTDYGRIHVVKKEQCPKGKWCDNPTHFSKPSLWKAGAEKICGMMGLRAVWPLLKDYERKGFMDASQVTHVMLRCELLDQHGAVVSEGWGARSLQQDYGDMNKGVKMAKKSSLIDAVLNAGGLSEVFTQDIEDMPEGSIGGADPYQPGEEGLNQSEGLGRTRYPLETHCPIGKQYRNVPWEQIDDGYLGWICTHIDDKPELVERAQRELGSRSVETQEYQDRRREKGLAAPTKKMAEYARELTACRTLQGVLDIKAELPTEFEPGLRTFIATRERELNSK